jgi:hypothetical protein
VRQLSAHPSPFPDSSRRSGKPEQVPPYTNLRTRSSPNKQETPGVFRTEGFVCGGYVRSRSLGQIIHPTNVRGRFQMLHDSTSLADRTGAANARAVVAVTQGLYRRLSPLQLGNSRDRLLRPCLRWKDRGTLDTGEMRGEHPGEIVSR